MARKSKSPAERQFWQSALLNDSAFALYYNRFAELAMSMFEWKGLPDTVSERYLELSLFAHGNAAFFQDDVIGFLALPFMPDGHYDVYGEPVRVTAYSGYNGYTCPLDIPQDGILIHNNLLHTTTKPLVEMYALRLYELDRTIDVNVRAQKTPVLIRCDEHQLLTLRNVYMKYDGNEPVIYGAKDLDISGFQVLKTDAPFVSDKLIQLKTQIYNEMLTALGITNINFSKRERLITDEVIRSQGSTIANRYSRLNQRRQACKEINARFGLHVSCDYREDLNPVIENILAGDPDAPDTQDKTADNKE